MWVQLPPPAHQSSKRTVFFFPKLFKVSDTKIRTGTLTTFTNPRPCRGFFFFTYRYLPVDRDPRTSYHNTVIHYITAYMRTVVNISLPPSMLKVVNKTVRDGSYSSKSEFFRMLVRLWMEGRLSEELQESRSELDSGKGKLLRSLKDLR